MVIGLMASKNSIDNVIGQVGSSKAHKYILTSRYLLNIHSQEMHLLVSFLPLSTAQGYKHNCLFAPIYLSPMILIVQFSF
jgi:hypothetical protein